ncbi:uncharacterized protein LOC143541737 [Bidens hawaiensis]|uniref:uncharacterized protein LOC143541737 n=1 Tax=Bidens hawaiensis TaxID=980011 RepID=UPI004049F0E6
MERYPPHRRKTPSFSSSLLDSILRSIDEVDNGPALSHEDNSHQQVHHHEWKWKNKPYISQTHLISEEEHVPRLQWLETRDRDKSNQRSSSKFSSDSSSGTASSGKETPSTSRSLPNCQNSFKIIPKTEETTFLNNTQKASSTKLEGKFLNLTKLRAMKMYRDLKRVKQPISPGNRLSTFIYSLFASSKKAKIEESMQSFKSLTKPRPNQQDTTMSCTSFPTSCMSKKQHSGCVKRSARFYPVIDTVFLDRKSIDERDSNSMPLPKKNSTKDYRNFMVNIEDNDEDEDDLFELEIIGGQELPVFETTDLRKIRI